MEVSSIVPLRRGETGSAIRVPWVPSDDVPLQARVEKAAFGMHLHIARLRLFRNARWSGG